MLNYTMRIILIGDCAVGKTAYATKLRYGAFQERYDATIGVDYSARTLCIHNKAMVKCQLWDTAGQENFAPLIKTYYKDIGGVLLVYDVNCRHSFNRLSFWISELNNHGPIDYPISKILIGNKIDLNSRKVSEEEAKKFATNNGFMYKEISVKQDINVDESLTELVEDAYKYKELNKGFKDSDVKYLDLKTKSESNKDREFCCCIC